MDALVAAGVAVRVVDDDVFRGDGQVDPQLVAGQTALGLGDTRDGSGVYPLTESAATGLKYISSPGDYKCPASAGASD